MAFRIAGAIGGLCAAGLASHALLAKEPKPVLVSYHKDSGVGLGMWGGKLLHSYGYKDKVLENGNWEVTGQAKSNLAEHSQYIAIYRAAEIAVAQGKTHIVVIGVNGKSLAAANSGSSMGMTWVGPDIPYGTRHIMQFQLSDTPDPEANCATDVLRPSCKTIEAAGAMQEIRPHLKFKDRK